MTFIFGSEGVAGDNHLNVKLALEDLLGRSVDTITTLHPLKRYSVVGEAVLLWIIRRLVGK